MAEKFSLKDELFNAEKVAKIASEIKNEFAGFQEEKFKKEILDKFSKLELKERIYHIRDMLAKYLPDDFEEAATILLKALPPELDRRRKDDGHPKTLIFLGYNPSPAIKIREFKLTSDIVKIGEALEFSFEIETQKEEGLIVDYIVYFRTKAGKLSPKVHKIKKLFLSKGESVKLSKKHHFKANMTTRKLYEGAQKIELQINGKVYESKIFQLMRLLGGGL